MPSYSAQRTAAIAEVVLHAQTEIQPVLLAAEYEAIVDANARATIWTANTAYLVGQTVLPTTRNGHRYRAIVGGTSHATTEPIWPKSKQATIQDGSSDPVLTWQEDGADYVNVFNVRAAIHQTWMLKAAKASILYATKQSGSDFEQQQVYDHCLKQSERWLPIEIS